jgi:hypothetical protein
MNGTLEEVSAQIGEAAVTPDEMVVKMGKPQETLQLHSGCGVEANIPPLSPFTSESHLNISCSDDVS